MPPADIITRAHLPNPAFTDPEDLRAEPVDVEEFDLGMDVGIDIIVQDSHTPAALVVDYLDRRGRTVPVYRFPTLTAAQDGARILCILHLLDRAASGATGWRAHAHLIDPQTGDTGAHIAIMGCPRPYDSPVYYLVDNRAPGHITAMEHLGAATQHYRALLTIHAAGCEGVEPYGDIAKLAAQHAAYRADLDYITACLAGAADETPDHLFTDVLHTQVRGQNRPVTLGVRGSTATSTQKLRAPTPTPDERTQKRPADWQGALHLATAETETTVTNEASSFRAAIEAQLADARKATSAERVCEIMPTTPDMSALGASGFCEGGDELDATLQEAGWRRVWAEAPYLWCMRAPDGSKLTYVEGDLYLGDAHEDNA